MNLSATIYTDTLTAGQVLPRQFNGAFFKIISSTGPVDIKTSNVNLKGLTAGQGFEKIPFDRVEITDASGASNTIRYIVASEGFLDGLTGSMQITQTVPPRSSSFANTAKTVTNVSAQLVAGNTSRTYLLVQNRDTSGSIYLNFGAGPATTANGVLIGPGGAYEMCDAQSTQAIQAIGSIASNANILVVEG